MRTKDALELARIDSTVRESVDPVMTQAAFRFATSHTGSAHDLEEGMFQTAQWVKQFQMAGSRAQMVARHAISDPRLSQLVRKRQDLVNEWRGLDKQLLFSSEPPDGRSAEADQARRQRMVAVSEHFRSLIEKGMLAEAHPSKWALFYCDRR